MNFKKYISVIVTVLLVAGCSEDIIDIQPEASVTPDIALKRVSGINALVLSAYKRVNEFSYYGQNQILNAEALADNLVIANNTGRYTGQVVNAHASHFGTWSNATYRIINDCNLILKYADASEPALETTGVLAGLPQSEALTAPRRLRYKGEAYFLRALAMHDIAKVYGYEPGKEVGGFNLAGVLRTTPVEGVTDANKRARSTNVEIYTQIKSDLLEAITLLPAFADFIGSTSNPNQQWAPGEKYFRVSKEAAKLLLARVYLYEGDNANADLYATQAITETIATGRPLVTAAGYAASWSQSANNANSEAIWECEIRAADWSSVDGVNNSLASITNSSPTGASNAQFAVAGSNELIASMEAHYTQSAAGTNKMDSIFVANVSGIVVGQPVTGTGIGAGATVVAIIGNQIDLSVKNTATFGANTATFRHVRRDVWVNNSGRNECKKWQGEKGTFLENLPLLRLSEAYLIAAEARAELNNDVGAQTALNTLRNSRGLVNTTATGATLKTLVQNERRSELCFEGHRFFDLKRKGSDIIKPASLAINNIPYTDYRILGNIPNGEITFNNLLVQNPNY